RVDAARLDRQGLRQRVDVRGPCLAWVEAAEIDRQTAVDEDPQVVVAREGEHLTADVSKLRLELQREVIVVAAPLVAESLAVDREKVAAVVVVYPALPALDQRDLDLRCQVDPGDVAVPLVEVLPAARREGRWAARVDGLSVLAELGGHDAQIEAGIVAFEVWVVVHEVTHRRAQPRWLGSGRVAGEPAPVDAVLDPVAADRGAGSGLGRDVARAPRVVAAALHARAAVVRTGAFHRGPLAVRPGPVPALLDPRAAVVFTSSLG